MAQAHSLAISEAVEWLEVLERPWGLAKLVFSIPIYLASLFIYLRKMPTALPPSRSTSSGNSSSSPHLPSSLLPFSRQPPASAIAIAASFPLGSIMPQYRSSRLYSAPSLNSALVPVTAHARCDTLTLVVLGSSLSSWTISRMVIRFMILVRLAISRFFRLRLPYRHRPSRISYRIQLLAVTLGICTYGLSLLRDALAPLRIPERLFARDCWEVADVEERGRCFWARRWLRDGEWAGSRERSRKVVGMVLLVVIFRMWRREEVLPLGRGGNLPLPIILFLKQTDIYLSPYFGYFTTPNRQPFKAAYYCQSIIYGCHFGVMIVCLQHKLKKYTLHVCNINKQCRQSAMLRQFPTLTDYSLLDYQPVRDLYDLLLSDSSDPCGLSSDKQTYVAQPSAPLPPSPSPTLDLSPSLQDVPRVVATRCNCLKSKCSKNYCECFRAGRQCGSECSCTGCGNVSVSVVEVGGFVGGCNCRKSRCLKKYCECHSRGRACSAHCHCLECLNPRQASSESGEGV